jgi:hypothetical protein
VVELVDMSILAARMTDNDIRIQILRRNLGFQACKLLYPKYIFTNILVRTSGALQKKSSGSGMGSTQPREYN